VEAGETLTSIAKKYRVTAASIAEANEREPGEGLTPGEKLIIPAARPVEETKSRLVRYRVRKGDTLGGVADQFSVTSEDIRKWNGLKSGKVSRGMVLRIYTVGGGMAGEGETRPVSHSSNGNSNGKPNSKSNDTATRNKSVKKAPATSAQAQP
jgi:LysM repeat protein